MHIKVKGKRTRLSEGLSDAAKIDKILAMIIQHNTDGAHHKQWLLDQIARVATGCPVVKLTAKDVRGRTYTYNAFGASERYLKWVKVYEADGEYEWDVGIPP